MTVSHCPDLGPCRGPPLWDVRPGKAWGGPSSHHCPLQLLGKARPERVGASLETLTPGTQYSAGDGGVNPLPHWRP